MSGFHKDNFKTGQTCLNFLMFGLNFESMKTFHILLTKIR